MPRAMPRSRSRQQPRGAVSPQASKPAPRLQPVRAESGAAAAEPAPAGANWKILVYIFLW
jgi:hypothetical protein